MSTEPGTPPSDPGDDAAGSSSRVDFFISYAGVDRVWAEWIAWQLEAAGHTTVLQAWDFRAGENFVLRMHDAVLGADRTIAVLSPDYLDRAFPAAEWTAIFAADPNGALGLLVPVRVRAGGDAGILRPRIYIDLVDLAEHDARGALLAGISRERAKPDAEPTFPGASAAASSPGERPFPASLPMQMPTRTLHFKGRENHLDWLLASLRPGCLLTLVGPGGIGKTALAAEAVWQLTDQDELFDRFPDGVIFHTFYNQPQVDAMLEEIARAFGLEPKPTPMEAARAALARRSVLLILDGAENADDLRKIIAVRGPGNGVLISSRRRSDAPDPAQARDVERLPQAEAISLLRDWAGAVAIDDDTAKRITTRVDGWPLAVRLVGRYLFQSGEPPADYATWLDESPYRTLVALRDDEHGHQEHNAALLMDRSVSKLPPAAHDALAVVGLLALAPFDVAPVAAAMDVPERDAARALGALFDYSLLVRREGGFEVSHALVHGYARRRVTAPEGGVLARLVEYFTVLVRSQSAHGAEGYATLNPIRPHLLSVLEACSHAGAWELIGRLAQVVDNYFDLQGHSIDRMTIIILALSATREIGVRRSEGEWLGKLGNANFFIGNMRRAITHHEQAMAIAREIGDRRVEGVALGNLGLSYRALGDTLRAIEHFEQALAISREIGDRQLEGTSLGNLGLVFGENWDVRRATRYYEQALAVAREIGDRRREGTWLGALGLAHGAIGDVGNAIGHLEQALTISREIGDRRGEINGLSGLGHAYLDRWDRQHAIEHFKQALAISREIGDRRNEGTELNNLGNAYRVFGAVRQAIERYEQALAIAREIGDLPNEGFILGNLGNAYSALGNRDLAVDHLRAALTIFEAIESPHAEMARRQLAELDPSSDPTP